MRRLRRSSSVATAAQTHAYALRPDILAPQLRAEIATVPAAPHGRPALIVVMGLPGVGKSHCARLLCGRLGAAHVASDELRSRLFVAASYADEENRAVFAAATSLVDALLTEGHRVVVDATNLIARNRAGTIRVARRHGIPVIYVLVTAPGEDTRYLLASLVVVIVGGMGSVAGAALGAVLIGLAEQFGLAYAPTYGIVFTFVIMALVLAFRPQGILGRRA